MKFYETADRQVDRRAEPGKLRINTDPVMTARRLKLARLEFEDQRSKLVDKIQGYGLAGDWKAANAARRELLNLQTRANGLGIS